MDTLAEHLGDGLLRVIEQVIPPASRFEDHSTVIGQCLILAFAMAVLWSVSGILRRR
jgi:hypothetical protein